MKSMGLGACLVAACLVGQARVSVAQARPAEVADTLNEEGKSLYKSQNYPEAAKKFHQAIELSPEARFYFNLCATLEKLQDYNGALEACDNVYAHDPADELKAKTGARAASIRAAQKKRAEDQAISPVTTPVTTAAGTQSGDPNMSPTPPAHMGQAALPSAQPQGFHTVSPQPQVHSALDQTLDYRWSLGADVGLMNQTLGENDSGENEFPDNGYSLKLHASYYVWPEARLGVQGYLALAGTGEGKHDGIDKRALSIVDVGGALYHHVKLAPKIYFTPLLGLHFTGIQPYQSTQEEPFGTIGLRLEGSFSFALGDSGHILSVAPMLSFYAPVSDSDSSRPAVEYGFDDGGGTFALTFGYTHRFKQGLSGPLIILE